MQTGVTPIIHWVRSHLGINRIGPVLGLLAVYVLFMLIGPASFCSAYNLETIVRQSTITGMAALGMTMVNHPGRHRSLDRLGDRPGNRDHAEGEASPRLALQDGVTETQ